jgi:hypothetical protein
MVVDIRIGIGGIAQPSSQQQQNKFIHVFSLPFTHAFAAISFHHSGSPGLQPGPSEAPLVLKVVYYN